MSIWTKSQLTDVGHPLTDCNPDVILNSTFGSCADIPDTLTGTPAQTPLSFELYCSVIK